MNRIRAVIVLVFLAYLVVLYCLLVHKDALTVIAFDTTAHQTSRRSTSRRSLRGYLVNLKYDGQQASAEHALVLQQCWLGALNLTEIHIVEPFLRKTVYQGYPPHQFDKPIPVFSDLHDLVHYNTVSRSRGFAQVVTWKEFIENGPRKVVFVNFGSSYSPHTHFTLECLHKSGTNCCSLLPKYDGMDFLSENGFCIVKIVDLQASRCGLNDHNLRNTLLSPWRPEEVTLVFSHWMQANSAQQLPVCFRVFRRSSMSDLMAPSKQLLQESRAYQKMFLGGSVDLSVMIRVERVIEQSIEGGHSAIARQNKTTRQAYLDKCFGTLFETVNMLGTKQGPFVATDIGKFSSNSWTRILSELKYSKTEAEHVFNMTRAAVEKLVNQQFTDWENTFVQSTISSEHWRNPAYIAALQRTIASNSKCLLLFGGGNFQEVALSEYLHNHPNKSTQCVHIVCASRALRRNLLEIRDSV